VQTQKPMERGETSMPLEQRPGIGIDWRDLLSTPPRKKWKLLGGRKEIRGKVNENKWYGGRGCSVIGQLSFVTVS